MVVFSNQNVAEDEGLRRRPPVGERRGRHDRRRRPDGCGDGGVGFGPAYIFHFIECLTAAAEKVGAPAETAKLLAMQTADYGAAALARRKQGGPCRAAQAGDQPERHHSGCARRADGRRPSRRSCADAVEAARARSVELGK